VNVHDVPNVYRVAAAHHDNDRDSGALRIVKYRGVTHGERIL
jgi:hypothetical protein